MSVHLKITAFCKNKSFVVLEKWIMPILKLDGILYVGREEEQCNFLGCLRSHTEARKSKPKLIMEKEIEFSYFSLQRLSESMSHY